jgi:nucleotide-binding universal stress UspA family protein
LKEDAEMFKRILVPLDGSELAEQVIPVVKMEAQCHNATVLLMRVVVPFRSLLKMSPAYLETTSQQVNEIVAGYLETVADQLRIEGIEVENIIEYGPPAEKIVEFAERGGCDLIIIGSRGETGALRWPIGGVTNKVARARLAVPVMIVTTKL